MSSTELTIVTESDLDKNLAESQLATESVQSLKAAFQPHFAAFTKLATAAQAIPDTAPKAAKAMRIELKNVRLAAEATRKEQKQESLMRGKAVDGLNNLLLYALSPIEKHLESIEKREEIAEKARLDVLRNTRSIELSKYTELPGYDLSTIPEAQYNLLLLGAKTAHEAKLKAEADRIEAERVASIQRAEKEKADAAERERLRLENEKLLQAAKEAEMKVAKERAEREAIEKARLAKEAAEKKKLADEAAAKQREIEETARKEKAAIEAKAKAEREEAQKKANDERKKREALEAEIKRLAQVEADKKASELAAQEAALAAPDKEKIKAFAQVISNLSIPSLTSKAGKALLPKLTEQVNKFAAWVNSEANKL